MDLIGKDDLFKWHMLLLQPLDEIGRLLKRNVAIIVPMHQQHWRLPLRDGGHRRGVKGQLDGILVVGSAIRFPSAQCRPVMYTVEVHAGSKDIGIAGESHRGKKSSIRASPDADAFGINIREPLEIPGSGHYIFVFCSPAPTAVGGITESPSIHNSQAIVDGKHHISQAGQILIFSIGVVVVVQGMEAQYHLTAGASMDKDERRPRSAMIARDE